MLAVEASIGKRLLEVRKDPRLWFQGFGRYRDEISRQPTRGRSNVLQRRMFAHYKECQEKDVPCRMEVLKYRRAGSSTGSSALMYLHSMNYHSRGGVIGTDYKASANMIDMISFFGKHDDFPGWQGAPKVAKYEIVPWEEKIEKVIATKIEWTHDSSVELYTANNPESARSAGLNSYHATEVGRWQSGGAIDGGETLTAMRNALPKKGFHLAIEESTARGAEGVFYDTVLKARWPDAEWAKKFAARFPLKKEPFPLLQFVFIFAAWFEDERHVIEVTEAEISDIQESLDDDEKELMERFGEEGPKGLRLGEEVDGTVWQQLAWRRMIIATVCTKRGVEEFREEYPATPEEAFQASGSPVFDKIGLAAIGESITERPPEYGMLSLQGEDREDYRVQWTRTTEKEAVYHLWERPIEGARYIVGVDTMSGAEQITGTGEKDRHSAIVLRGGFVDGRGVYFLPKVVCRLRVPCQYDIGVLSRFVWMQSLLYGNAPIIVEANQGIAVINELKDRYRADLVMREVFDHVSQSIVKRYGFWTTDGSKSILIGELQNYVREQKIEIGCPHLLDELSSYVTTKNGGTQAARGKHDDDVMALALGVYHLSSAKVYRLPE